MTDLTLTDQYAVNKDGLIIRPGQTARWQGREWTVEKIHRYEPDGPTARLSRPPLDHEREWADIDGRVRVRVEVSGLRTPGAKPLRILL